MKLTIARTQAHQGTDRKGRSQGVVFTFTCRLQLDDHERELVDKYRLWGYPLVHLRMTELRDLSENDTLMSPERLLEGWTFPTRYVSDALHAEDGVKEGCAAFKEVLRMMESYGGQEEVEFKGSSV